MPSVAPVLVIQAASVLASGLVAWKLYSTGLFRKYRLLFAYMLFRVPNLTCFAFLDVRSPLYSRVFVIAQTFVWFFYVAVVFELFSLVLARHKGLYTVGKWVMCAAIAIALLISGISLSIKITPQMQRSSVTLGIIVAIDRGLGFGLAISLVLMLALLSFYTVPLSRNVLVHAVVYTVYFLSCSLSMILRTMFGVRNLAAVDTGAMAVSLCCVMAWYLFLTEKGEETRTKLPWFGAEQEERILYHLDSLNATLLRATRK
jgi:hypothetical protein